MVLIPSKEGRNLRQYGRAGSGSEWLLVIRGDTGQDDLCRPWESMARWHVIKSGMKLLSVGSWNEARHRENDRSNSLRMVIGPAMLKPKEWFGIFRFGFKLKLLIFGDCSRRWFIVDLYLISKVLCILLLCVFYSVVPYTIGCALFLVIFYLPWLCVEFNSAVISDQFLHSWLLLPISEPDLLLKVCEKLFGEAPVYLATLWRFLCLNKEARESKALINMNIFFLLHGSLRQDKEVNKHNRHTSRNLNDKFEAQIVNLSNGSGDGGL
ncbi:hypothetical protein LguiB_013029 [Lonicera macranthoides]